MFCSNLNCINTIIKPRFILLTGNSNHLSEALFFFLTYLADINEGINNIIFLIISNIYWANEVIGMHVTNYRNKSCVLEIHSSLWRRYFPSHLEIQWTFNIFFTKMQVWQPSQQQMTCTDSGLHFHKSQTEEQLLGLYHSLIRSHCDSSRPTIFHLELSRQFTMYCYKKKTQKPI